MAKETKPDVVEVPREEWEEMKRSNAENTGLVNELVNKLDIVQNAQLAGVGVDPKIAARALLPRTTVQFLRAYSRSALPSNIQEGAIVIEAYSVDAGDIVNLREDEVKRLQGEFPDLLITEKFTDKIVHGSKFVPNEKTGRMEHQLYETPISVETLTENMIEAG